MIQQSGQRWAWLVRELDGKVLASGSEHELRDAQVAACKNTPGSVLP